MTTPPSQAPSRGGAGGSIETLHRSPNIAPIHPVQLFGRPYATFVGFCKCNVSRYTENPLTNHAKRRGTTFTHGRHDFTHIHIFAKSLETSIQTSDIYKFVNQVVLSYQEAKTYTVFNFWGFSVFSGSKSFENTVFCGATRLSLT